MHLKTTINNMWKKINNQLKRQTKLKDMYFVKKGERVGQFLILINFDIDKQLYSVLGLPDSDVLYISKKDIDFGIANNILDFVKALPNEVFNDCQNEFKYRESIK